MKEGKLVDQVGVKNIIFSSLLSGSITAEGLMLIYLINLIEKIFYCIASDTVSDVSHFIKGYGVGATKRGSREEPCRAP